MPGVIHLQTEIPGPASRALVARRATAVPRGVPAVTPIAVVHAEGAVITDADGNRLIDFGGGIGVVNTGHRHPGVVEAVRASSTASPTSASRSPPTSPTSRWPSVSTGSRRARHEKRTFFVNSGAEAVENAVKVRAHFTGRQAILCFEHGFHGRTNLAMALTSKVMPYKKGFGPFAPEVYRIPYPYCYRCAEGARRPADGAAWPSRRGSSSIFAAPGGPRLGGGGDHGAGAGRGRIRAGTGGIRPDARRLREGSTASCSSPTRSRPASGARADVRLRALRPGARHHHHRQVAGRRAAARGGHRPGRRHGGAAGRRARRHLRRQPARLRGGARGARRDGRRADPGARSARRRPGRGALPQWAAPVPLHRRRARARRDGRHGAGVRPRDPRARQGAHRRGSSPPRSSAASFCSPSGTFGNTVRVLAPLTADDAVIDEGLDVLGAALEAAVGRAPAMAWPRGVSVDRGRLAALAGRGGAALPRRASAVARRCFERAQALAARRRADELDGALGRAASRSSSTRPRAPTSPTSTATTTSISASATPGAMTGHAPPATVEAIAAPGAPRHHLHAADRGRRSGSARSWHRRFGLPYWQFALTRDRRQPLRHPARPAAHRAAEDPGLQLVLPRHRRRDLRHPATTARPSPRAGQRRPAGRPGAHDEGRRVQRPRRARGGARARRRRLRARRAGADQHRHRAPRPRLPRRAARAHPAHRHAADHRRDPHDLRRARRLHRGARPRARHAHDRQADRRRRARPRSTGSAPRSPTRSREPRQPADDADTGGIGGTLAGNALCPRRHARDAGARC